jgi:hypothetical protein
LEWLVLSSCTSITNIYSVFALLDHLPALTKLYLPGCGLSPDASRGRTPSRNWPNIQHLYLSECIDLDDDMALQFITRMPNLQTLVLANCKRLTYKTFLGIAETCHKMRDLDLSFCEVDDASILAIMSNCAKNMISLKLANSKQISTQTFLTILSTPKQLESLTVSGCPAFTHSVLKAVPELCPSLSRLILGRENGISKKTKKEITTAHPNLTII